MSEVVFIDTSVLLNLCNVPNMNADHKRISEEFIEASSDGSITMIVPVAALIETGNHIEHISNGSLRRQCAHVLSELIRMSVAGEPPWVISNCQWDSDFLESVRVGRAGSALLGLIEASVQNVGTGLGDLSIIHEALEYRQRVDTPSGKPVRVWTIDSALGVIAESVLEQ